MCTPVFFFNLVCGLCLDGNPAVTDILGLE